jgi:exosortase
MGLISMRMVKPRQVLPQDWRLALIGAAAGGVLAAIILWPTVLSLTHLWRSNQAYQFAWLIPPLMVYLLGWCHRPTTLQARPQPDLTGVVVTLAAALCWGASDLMNIDVGRQFSLILVIQGICMSALGWRSYWKLSPVLWLMFFMIPTGDLFQPVLRHLTVKVIELFAMTLHLPHSIDGFVIIIGKADYVVLNECAGLPYFLLATFLGYAFGLMLNWSSYKLVILTLFGAFIGLLSNALRVCSIVLTDWLQGSEMPLSAHSKFQWIALALSLAILFFVLGKLDDDHAGSTELVTPTNPVSYLRVWNPVLAGFVVLVISGGQSWMTSLALPANVSLQPLPLPQKMAGWTLVTPTAEWQVNTENGTRSLMLGYRHDQKTLDVHIVETVKAEAKLQETQLAPGKAGVWHENSIESQAACAESPCIKLTHTTWENGKTEEKQNVYSSYAMGSFFTTSKFALRAAHGWARLTGGNSNPRLIGFTTNTAVSPEEGKELAQMLRILQAVLERRGSI